MVTLAMQCVTIDHSPTTWAALIGRVYSGTAYWRQRFLLLKTTVPRHEPGQAAVHADYLGRKECRRR